MSILRKRTRQDKFTVLPNDTLQDESLSWKARGILVYLLSMPDNWSFNQQDLKNRATDGKTSLQTGLDELETQGYLERRQSRDEEGNFSRNDWIVYESLSLRDDGSSGVDVKPDDANCVDVGSPTTKDTGYKEHSNTKETERDAPAREPEENLDHAPSYEQVMRWCQMDGVRKEVGQKFYFHYEAVGWIINGSPIRKPRAKLQQWKVSESKYEKTDSDSKSRPINDKSSYPTFQV